MKNHELKILTRFFKAQVAGTKRFEIRLNDRDYQVGDTLTLNEVVKKGGGTAPTGDNILVRVTYMLRAHDTPGLEKGFVIMGTEPVL